MHGSTAKAVIYPRQRMLWELYFILASLQSTRRRTRKLKRKRK